MKIHHKIESPEHISRFSFKVMRNLISLALIVLLVIAWLASDPILRMSEGFLNKARNRTGRRQIKRHLLTKRIPHNTALAIISTATTIWSRTAEAQLPAAPTDSGGNAVHTWSFSNTNIWQNGVGNGFKAGVQSISLSFGAGYGLRILDSRQSHDLALDRISNGYILGATEDEGHLYRGNGELRGGWFF